MRTRRPSRSRRAAQAFAAGAIAFVASGSVLWIQEPPPSPPARPSPLERAFIRRDDLLHPEGGDVVVAAGDTLAEIATRHGTTAQAVARANAMKVSDPIYAGQILFVPKAGR